MFLENFLIARKDFQFSLDESFEILKIKIFLQKYPQKSTKGLKICQFKEIFLELKMLM